MNDTLKSLSEVIAKANDVFSEKFSDVDTLMGIMDKTLRKQGMNADAITIDCVAPNKKIVIVLHDDKPDVVDVALGTKSGEIFSSSEYQLNTVSEQVVADIMQDYFVPSEAV